MVTLKKYIRLDFIWPLILRFSAGAIGILLNLAIIKILGTSAAGIFATFLSMATLMGLFCTIGLDSYVLRELGTKAAQRKPQEYTASYGLSTLIVIVVSLIAGFVLHLVLSADRDIAFLDNSTNIVTMASLCAIPLALSSLNSEALKSIGFVSSSVVFKMLMPAALTIICLLFAYSIKFEIGLTSIEQLFVLNCWITLLVSAAFFIWKSEFELPDISHFKSVLIKIKDETTYLFLFTVCSASIKSMSLLIFASFALPDKVAVLAVCIRIAMVIGIVLSAINAVLLPKAVKIHAVGEKSELESTIEQYTVMCTLVCIPVCFIICLAAKPILGFFSPEFTAFALVLIILAIGEAFSACAGPVGYLSIVFEDTKMLALIYLAAAILTSIAVYLSSGDIVFTAFIIAISIILVNIILFLRIRKNHGISTSPILNFVLRKPGASRR